MSEQSKQIEAQKREDILMDMYKLHAYIPNDAEGNPLTPFGNFCAGYEAATAEADKRIEVLEGEVAELKETLAVIEDGIEADKAMDKALREVDANIITKLQASNNDLREALVNCLDMIGHEDNIEYINKVLAATPAESLQAHDNELIEKCAKVCDHVNQQYSDIFKDTKDRFNDGASYGADDCAEAIRALKGVK